MSESENLSETKIQGPADIIGGRYRVLEKIGQGGMGVVYKVLDQELQRIVALKMLLTETSATPKDIERFQREAKTSALLRHPNIVTVYDCGISGDRPFFTMELLTGQSLQQFLKKSSLTTRQVVDIMIKIGNAIHYAHGQGIIHRDLKPANIMLENDLEPKVMDFGLAKLSRASSKISKSGMILGTLNYMPPEQAEGKLTEIDVRSDVYTLGGLLYEMLTNRPPFVGTSTFHILSQIATSSPPPPRRIKHKIARELESICMKALAKKKTQRYQTAAEFVEDLQRFARREPVKTRPVSRQGTVLLLSALVLMLLTVSVVWYTRKPKDIPPKNLATQNSDKDPKHVPSTTKDPKHAPSTTKDPKHVPFTASVDFSKGHEISLNAHGTCYKGSVSRYADSHFLLLSTPAESYIVLHFDLPSLEGQSWYLYLDHLTPGDERKKPMGCGYAPVNISVNQKTFRQNYDPASHNDGKWEWFCLDKFPLTEYLQKGTNNIKIILGREASVHYWLRKIEVKNF